MAKLDTAQTIYRREIPDHDILIFIRCKKNVEALS